eukprot:gene10030-2204_t
MDVVVGREREIQFLRRCVRSNYSPPVFVYGVPSTGKSMIVRKVIKESGSRYAFINCLEAYSPRVLFEQILNSLSGELPGPENLYGGYARCDTVAKFIKLLTQIFDKQDASKSSIFVVLDRCDRMRRLKQNVLSVFLRLRELTRRNIGVVMISTIVWHKFPSATGLPQPLTLHIPAYTKTETLAILQHQSPPGAPLAHFRQFVELLWGVFHGPCRDLSELRHLTCLLFDKYYAPVREGTISPKNTAALYKNIAPVLKSHLSNLYLRETSTSEWLQNDGKAAQQLDSSMHASKIELPYYAKVIVIAAFLASHNPQRSDYIIFSKQQRKRTKRRKGSLRPTKSSASLSSAPKPFSLSRLFAIFHSLLGEKVDMTAEMYSHVASLVSLRLLSQATSHENLDSAKFKCNISIEDAFYLGRTIEIDIAAYLHEVNG